MPNDPTRPKEQKAQQASEAFLRIVREREQQRQQNKKLRQEIAEVRKTLDAERIGRRRDAEKYEAALAEVQRPPLVYDRSCEFISPTGQVYYHYGRVWDEVMRENPDDETSPLIIVRKGPGQDEYPVEYIEAVLRTVVESLIPAPAKPELLPGETTRSNSYIARVFGDYQSKRSEWAKRTKAIREQARARSAEIGLEATVAEMREAAST